MNKERGLSCDHCMVEIILNNTIKNIYAICKKCNSILCLECLLCDFEDDNTCFCTFCGFEHQDFILKVTDEHKKKLRHLQSEERELREYELRSNV